MKTKLEGLSEQIEKTKKNVKTEEATKTSFVLPFIQILGYNVFDPTEVVPEYVADIGIKKGEKVDYAIFQDETPIIIIECKAWNCDNLKVHKSQLFRYYSTVKARFGVITNGIVYNFYTDLENPNLMDTKPFLTIDLLNLRETDIKELQKFTKENFNEDNILNSAEQLKFIKSIRAEFEKELSDTSDEFIKMLVSRFYGKKITSNRMETFKIFAKKAISNSINELVNIRLKNALNVNNEEEKENNEDMNEAPRIITTEEEVEGFAIVKAILREKVKGDRITPRDTQSYFGILLDDNNRKSLCRLHFNSSVKYIEVFHNGKENPEKIQINNVDDIYKYKNELLKAISNY